MKRLISLTFAALMIASALVLPAVAVAQSETQDDCCSHDHTSVAAEWGIMPIKECDHDWPYSTIYRQVRVGCKIYQRYYKLCSYCGEEYSWYSAGAATTSHKGPYIYERVGTDTDGSALYKKKCKACGVYCAY